MPRLGPLALSILCALLPALAPMAGRAAEPEACWRPEALKAVEAERAPRRGGPGARVPVPVVALHKPASLSAHLHGSIRRVALPPGLKLVALTFDLCEANGEVAGYDGGIVDYLRAHNIRATFFAGGKWLETHAERAQQLIADPLFQIGNHGWSHRNLRKLAGQDMENEIARAEAAYEDIRGKLAVRACMAVIPAAGYDQPPSSEDRRGAKRAPAAMTRIPERLTLFRFPFGACNAAALRAVADAGMATIQWDVVTGDPAQGQSAERIAATVLKRAKPGSIIVAHANGRGYETAHALPLFIPQMQAAGYRFVTVGELLAAGTPVAADTCYEERPGDTDRY